MCFSPAEHTLDVKKSSYKKVSRFLKNMQDRGFIKVKELTKGVESIVEIHKDHEEWVTKNIIDLCIILSLLCHWYAAMLNNFIILCNLIKFSYKYIQPKEFCHTWCSLWAFRKWSQYFSKWHFHATRDHRNVHCHCSITTIFQTVSSEVRFWEHIYKLSDLIWLASWWQLILQKNYILSL